MRQIFCCKCEEEINIVDGHATSLTIEKLQWDYMPAKLLQMDLCETCTKGVYDILNKKDTRSPLDLSRIQSKEV